MGDAKGKGKLVETHVPDRMDDVVSINIKLSDGRNIALRVDLKLTVGVFKEFLAQRCDVPASQQRLISQGMELQDDRTLRRCGVKAEQTVYMITTTAKPSVGRSTKGRASVASASHVASSCGVRLRTTPLTASEFNVLGGNGMPKMDQMQQYLSQNSDRMKQIMNTPSVQNLMNNPELMRSMVMNTPQSREIMDRNPELAQLCNDPAIVKGALEKMKNPEFMRLMMQSTGGVNAPKTNSTAVRSEELYATELSRLQEMGYLNTEANIRALQAASGNVQAAAERLQTDGNNAKH